jgi:dihydropteroate synthase
VGINGYHNIVYSLCVTVKQWNNETMIISSINMSAALPLIMGVLNVTPDSYYDGGKHNSPDAATARAQQMISEGATIIDCGGESTGPGSVEVGEEEEMRRIMPIMEKINHKLQTKNYKPALSIDTTKASVARRAMECGATIVNDVSAGRHDPAMFPLVAETGCKIVLMYSKDETPRTTVRDQQYDDVMATVKAFLMDRITIAESRGIRHEQIIVDPGLGHFVSSDPRYSWEILERLKELTDLGCPILVSPSRKSFTADPPDDPPEKRLPGTLRATKIAIRNGASIIRTHDVKETMEMINIQFSTYIESISDS